jgi:hypothetical protein
VSILREFSFYVNFVTVVSSLTSESISFVMQGTQTTLAQPLCPAVTPSTPPVVITLKTALPAEKCFPSFQLNADGGGEDDGTPATIVGTGVGVVLVVVIFACCVGMYKKKKRQAAQAPLQPNVFEGQNFNQQHQQHPLIGHPQQHKPQQQQPFQPHGNNDMAQQQPQPYGTQPVYGAQVGAPVAVVPAMQQSQQSAPVPSYNPVQVPSFSQHTGFNAGSAPAQSGPPGYSETSGGGIAPPPAYNDEPPTYPGKNY